MSNKNRQRNQQKQNRPAPQDHRAASVPFASRPGAEHFKAPEQVDALEALELIAELEELIGSQSEEGFSLKEVKSILKAVISPAFIKDVERFKQEFFHAANLNAALETTTAYVEELGKELR